MNYNMFAEDEALPPINNSVIDSIGMTENTAKRPCLSVTQNIRSSMTNSGYSPVTRSYNLDTLYLFDNMCKNVKEHGICKRYRCTYPHALPVNWEITLQNMPIESLWNLYNNAKKGMKLYIFKKIFPIVVKQLGFQRDFNKVISLVKDVLEINIGEDQTPYLSAIIDALRSIGMTFNDVIAFIFNTTFVARNLKDLLTDILFNITMGQDDIENNWSAMHLLMKYRNYQVDAGIIKTILIKCLKKTEFQKELCLKVYSDLICRISDDTLEIIDPPLLGIYIECMRTSGLSNESQTLYERIVTRLKVVLDGKPSGVPYTSTSAAPPYAEEIQMYGMNAVKQAIFTGNLSQLMSLILEYKEGDLTDEFLQTCLDAMQEGTHNFPVLFRNLCQSVTVLQNEQDVRKDKSLEYVLKTIGTNLIIYSTSKDKWKYAYNIYQALRNLYNESDILNVKMLYVVDKPSYIKRLLIICRIFVKKNNAKHAWELFKVNSLHTSCCWPDEADQQDIQYRDLVFTELMTGLDKGKRWETTFTIIEYIFKENIYELDSLVDATIQMAVQNDCHAEYILSFMYVCPVWYNRIHCHTFRAIVVALVRKHMYTMARTLYRQGCEMNIYPHLIGNEECLEFSTHYVLEEMQLMLKVFLQNMVSFMPVTHTLVIRVQQSAAATDDTGTELPSLLYQNNMSCEGMHVRIVNILNNNIKPPIRVVNKFSQLEITPAELEKHLEVRRKCNQFC